MPEPGADNGIRRRSQRLLLRAAGMASLGVGALGVALPLLPATPFLLLAAACFAKSSPRLHGWMLDHKWFGPTLRSWEQERAVPRRAKRAGVAALWVTLPLTIAFAPAPWWARASVAVVLVVATVLLVRLPVTDETAAATPSTIKTEASSDPPGPRSQSR